jgi:hypothetical protein
MTFGTFCHLSIRLNPKINYKWLSNHLKQNKTKPKILKMGLSIIGTLCCFHYKLLFSELTNIKEK